MPRNHRSKSRQGLPVVAIVGRPNVGKSTLFNRLVGKRQAIVGDRPGVTVDRIESHCRLGRHRVMLVDTGGIGEETHDLMQPAIDAQVEAALAVADVVMFVVDARAGCTPVDEDIANRLRRYRSPVVLLANKAEEPDTAIDFHALGLGDPLPVSAAHGQGIRELHGRIDALLSGISAPEAGEQEDCGDVLASIAVIGRPNVGKSTLINAWLGQERMVVSDIAGTTRDAVDVDMPYGEGVIRLVDTAGQRRRSRFSDVIEFVARVKAVQAFRRADAAVVLLDAAEGIVEQDLRLMRLAFEEGCALVVAVNKMDLLRKREWEHLAERLDFRMRGMPDLPIMRISAKQGEGIKRLLDEAVAAARRNHFEIGTGELNRWLMQAQQAQHPPSDHGAPVRLKYASQTGSRPPRFKVFCNRPDAVKESYRRYLEQSFRRRYGLLGVPLRFQFVASVNPYAGNKRLRGGKR